jgi:hypothetical protein
MITAIGGMFNIGSFFDVAELRAGVSTLEWQAHCECGSKALSVRMHADRPSVHIHDALGDLSPHRKSLPPIIIVIEGSLVELTEEPQSGALAALQLPGMELHHSLEEPRLVFLTIHAQTGNMSTVIVRSVLNLSTLDMPAPESVTLSTSSNGNDSDSLGCARIILLRMLLSLGLVSVRNSADTETIIVPSRLVNFIALDTMLRMT